MSNLIQMPGGKSPLCSICGEYHIIQNRCRQEALSSKISKLTEANSFIPHILEANKEATNLAAYFKELVRKSDEAHGILVEVLSAHGEIGEAIKNEYLEKLNNWAPQVVQETQGEQLPLFKEESENGDKNI